MFSAKVENINDWLVVRFPKSESEKLPSRGQVAITGTIDGHEIREAIEPDGAGSHWLHISEDMNKKIKVSEGDEVKISVENTKEWPEPEIPSDVQKEIVENPETADWWKDITTASRWEWMRWIQSTNNPETRKKRIVVSISKMNNGMRRPCCFNRSMCCVPQVSKSGVLIGS